eukprot:6175459-Pleurochrysis_carterae.AAC.2
MLLPFTEIDPVHWILLGTISADSYAVLVASDATTVECCVVSNEKAALRTRPPTQHCMLCHADVRLSA